MTILSSRAALAVSVMLLVTGLAAGGAASAQSTVEILPLRYRSADELIPVIRPLVAPDGTVTSFQGKLLVRTTRRNLEEIRRVLASIDIPRRRLVITVRQEAASATGGSSVSVAGYAEPAHAGQEGGAGVTARVLDTRTAGNDRNTQVVQAVEGALAYIHVGQSIPVTRRTLVGTQSGRGLLIERDAGVEYREVRTGFYALPKVVGSQVTLALSSQRETLSGQHEGRIDVQRAATTVTGRLGEWIEVGGISHAADGEQSLLLGRTTYGGGTARRVLVKVEEVK